MQPMFTFSPDGKSIYAFQPGPAAFKFLATIALAMLLALALALVQMGQLAMGMINFVLNAPGPVILRIVLIITGLLALLGVRLAMQIRTATRKGDDV